MVRCEQFYEYWEKRGNFCGKSDMVAKKVEEYIEYIRRNKLQQIGGYKISNCAIDPFINIESTKGGRVHTIAVKELKNLLKKEKIRPEKITRRISIELINKANNKVGDSFKLENIPNIRSRMREFEHDIDGIGFEVRNTFDALKKDLGAKNNNEAMKVMLEAWVRDPDSARKIKEEMDKIEEAEQKIEIVAPV